MSTISEHKLRKRVTHVLEPVYIHCSTLLGNLLLKILVALSLDRLYQKRAFDSAPSLKTRLRMRPEEYTLDVDAEGRASVLKAMSCCLSNRPLLKFSLFRKCVCL